MAKPRPVCVECLIEMNPAKNGVYVETVLSDKHKDNEPYEIYEADLWECPSCGSAIITGFGHGAVLQYWHEDYKEKRDKLVEAGNYIYTLRK